MRTLGSFLRVTQLMQAHYSRNKALVVGLQAVGALMGLKYYPWSLDQHSDEASLICLFIVYGFTYPQEHLVWVIAPVILYYRAHCS